MRNSNWIAGFIITLLISLGLGFASVYGARFAHQDDLGQLAYMLLFFFPLTAFATGAAARLTIRRIWSAPVITLLTFLIVMISAFRNVNYLYILTYVLISMLGYGVAFLFTRSRK